MSRRHRGGTIYGCLRKRHYDTEEEARQAAATVGRKTGDKVSPFRCRFCQGYLIGKPGGKVR